MAGKSAAMRTPRLAAWPDIACIGVRRPLQGLAASPSRVNERQSLRFGRILRRIDVKERIERLCRPFRDGDTVAGGPHLNLAKAFVDQRVPQVLAQGDRP